MLPIKALLAQFLRGRQLVSLILHLAPFAVLMILGMVWLVQTGWAIPFVLVSCGVIAIYRLVWLAIRYRRKQAELPDPLTSEAPLVAANPDWSAREQQIFTELSAGLHQKLQKPLEWDQIQPAALDLLREAAQKLSGGKRDILDFSLPEALLLATHTLTRLRRDLRRYLPLAETISLSTLIWVWRHRSWFGHANTARRVVSAYLNPPKALIQEAQAMLLGEASGLLRGTAEITLQRLVLEEVARSAIDLYGGYLRFSEAELLQITLASQSADLAHQAQDDLPLRVVVVGQVSAGKTSLINALAGEARGEVDLSPSTPALVSHQVELGSGLYTFADTEGIDGSDKVMARVLAQMLEADLILWAVRANRPARAVDVALMDQFRAVLAANPARRGPRILIAVTAMDSLLPHWPLPEQWIPPEDQAKIAEVLRAVAQDLGQEVVIPVVTRPPDWNIDQLEAQISREAAEALMVQRNRRRLTAQSQSGGVISEATKAGQGAFKAGQLLWQNWRRGE